MASSASVREIVKSILLSELADDSDVLCIAQQYENAKVTDMIALKLCLKDESDPEAHFGAETTSIRKEYPDLHTFGHLESRALSRPSRPKYQRKHRARNTHMMSDEEDYNSEDDGDYVPSEGELGSEEENSGDEEDLSVLDDDAGIATSNNKVPRKKQNKDILARRKRKGGIKLDGEGDTQAEEPAEDPANKELGQKLKEEEVAKKAEKEKQRANDLWSSFLSDVKPHARPQPKTTQASTVKTSSNTSTAATSSSVTTTSSSTTKPSAGKMTITKVFDFAGEEVKVTKEVDVDSKEAKEELKKQEESQQQITVATSSSPLASKTPSASSSPAPGNSILGAKRPAAGGGLGGVLSKIGKKQKMGTLEKSKMDWDSFKKKEGIDDDLKIHNKGKDGYIERMAFLNRADVRQYEIERDLRLSKSGKR